MMKLEVTFSMTPIPCNDTTMEQPRNGLWKEDPKAGASQLPVSVPGFIPGLKEVILTQEASKARSNATSPPHPTPAPNVISHKLLFPEAAGKVQNPFFAGRKPPSSHWIWIHSSPFVGPQETMAMSKLAALYRGIQVQVRCWIWESFPASRRWWFLKRSKIDARWRGV